jgi:AraC-like DNA-binding protein
MEIATVPVNYVKAMLASAVRNGCDGSSLLDQAGIAEELLATEKARVPATKFVQLSHDVMDLLQDENRGFLERTSRPGTFAMMCYACIHRPTLGQFLRRGIDFYHIVSDCYDLQLTVDGDLATYTLTPKAGMVDPDHFMLLCLQAIVHRLSCWLIGQNLGLQVVNFTHPRPAHANDYNLLFRSPIRFDQPDNSLVFSANKLDLPNLQNEESLEKFLTLPSLALMSLPDYETSLLDRIRLMIKGNVGGEFPEIEAIAERLNLTPATLRRRLRHEGSSYQKIKDDIRRDTAIYLLGSGARSIEQVAEDIGFNEPTSFYRAFRRWTGVTPRDYVKRTAG